MGLLALALVGVLASVATAHGDHRHHTWAPASQRLRPPSLLRLPTGATKPLGWLKDELTLQARGLSGQLPSFWVYFVNSSWLGQKGRDPQQFLPYYMQGAVPLSYQLDDANLAKIRDGYINYIMEHQNTSDTAFLGPDIVASDPHEYWSKYDMIEAFEYYAEAEPTKGVAIKAALVKHQRALYAALTANAPDFNSSRWGVDRYSDGIIGIEWLLDQGEGDTPDGKFLWDLLRLLRTEADKLMAARDHDWESWFAEDLPNDFSTGSTSPFNYSSKAQSLGGQGDATGFIHLLRHGVDIGQAWKTGPLWWRVDGLQQDWDNGQAAIEWSEAYLHRADGMYFADEEVDGEHTPSRGTETCSVVETMFSLRVNYEITANISFMDRLEVVAFNALPAALYPDATTNVYHHANNQIETGTGAPYAYDLYFCCSANVHQGWPKFMFSAVQLQQLPANTTDTLNYIANAAATIVVSSYAPSVSTLPDNNVVTISGTYPFSDTAIVTVAKPTTDLRLRVPCWSEYALVRIGQASALSAPPCAFFNISRQQLLDQLPTISGTDAVSINITFVNKIRLHEWKKSSLDGQSLIEGGGIEVHRGPLLFALRPPSTDVGDLIHQQDGFPPIRHHTVTIAENASWNYGIYTDSLIFNGAAAPIPASVPFSATAPTPVTITAKAKRVPSWTSAGGARGIAALPHSPLSSTEAEEEIVLVPYGSTNIRVSVMPQLCDSGAPGCPPPPPPGPPHPPTGSCEPTGPLPPNAKEDMNLPGGDLEPGGRALSSFNTTECYARCVAWNTAAATHNAAVNPHSEKKALCDAWVATDSKLTSPGHPWCWLKSHKAQKGYVPKQQKCYISAQCRVGVPASEFPCPPGTYL